MEGDEPLARYTFAPKPYGRRLALALHADRLDVDDGARVSQVPFGDIARIALIYKPSNLLTAGFLCTVTTRAGRVLTIASHSWRSMVINEDQGPAYRAFVAALCGAVAARHSACVFRAGRGRAIWLIGLLAALVLASSLAMLVVYLLRDDRTLAAVLFATASLGLTWVMVDVVVRNRPRLFMPQAPPPELLPAA